MIIDRPRQEMETEIERLRERCEAYKGQVEAGAHEIGRLRARIEQLEAAFKGASSKLRALAQYSDISGMLLADLADEIDAEAGNQKSALLVHVGTDGDAHRGPRSACVLCGNSSLRDEAKP